jgi:hypothetical protein
MVRSVANKAKDAITDAAQRSVDSVRSIAGDAFGAAAKAAAEVVLESTTTALEAGRAKIKQSAPAMKRAIGIAARQTVSKRGRAKTAAKKTVAKRKTTRSKRKTKPRSRK